MNIKKFKFISLGFMLLLFCFFLQIKISSAAVYSCCYHECYLEEQPKCDGAIVQVCGECDDDPYNDWCDTTDCALDGKSCVDGSCEITNCADGTSVGSCSGVTGEPWYCNGSGELVQQCGICGCYGDWVCGVSGESCCDNTCNGVCSGDACSSANDPDCTCKNFDGCCAVGCDYRNDSDCEIVIADEVCDCLTEESCVGLIAPFNTNQAGICSGSHQKAYWQDFYSDINNYQFNEIACDGLDNDCDGITDEGCDCIDNTEEPCGTNIGECKSGIITCLKGSWSSCVGSIEPNDEICDALDNNCNGVADEDLTLPNSDNQEGVCDNSKKECGGLLGWLNDYSNIPNYEISETICDDLDNDCDGKRDEDLGQTTCGLGICEHTIDNCRQGKLQICNPFDGALKEVCDGIKDENCDGTVDEGCDCVNGESKECGIDTGACQKGLQECIRGDWTTCVGNIIPKNEICGNDIDEDCNGVAEECECQDTICNGVCGENCSAIDDPDCACGSNNSCCGIGCSVTTDNDCSTDCGDGNCSAGENCQNCATDCGECSDICGDGYCDTSCNESYANCPSDCDSSCGDDYCDLNKKECSTCATDCDIAKCCGDGECSIIFGEDYDSCSTDCNKPDDDYCTFPIIFPCVLAPSLTNTTFANSLVASTESTVGCFNECSLTDPAYCDGNKIIECQENCDNDYYNDECEIQDCSLTDQTCLNGACFTTCFDLDQDGYDDCDANVIGGDSYAKDCNDSNSNINPGAVEVCEGSIDEDCDGVVDEDCVCINSETKECGDYDLGACQLGTETCINGNWGDCIGEIIPTTEICDNRIDDDCDGSMDCDDTDCVDYCTDPCINECDYGTWGCETEDSEWTCVMDYRDEACPDKLNKEIVLCEVDTKCTPIIGKCEEATSTLQAVIIKPISSPGGLDEQSLTYTLGEIVDFEALVTGGVAPYTYSWKVETYGLGGIDDLEEASTIELGQDLVYTGPIILDSGYYYLSFTVEDSLGNIATYPNDNTVTIYGYPISLLIRVCDPLSLNIISPQNGQEFQVYDDVNFTLEAKGCNNPFVYSIVSDVDGEIGNFSTWSTRYEVNTYSLSPEKHNITYKIVDAGGEEKTESINIDIVIPAYPVSKILSPGNDTAFVDNETVIFTSAEVFGGVAPYTYKWISDIDTIFGSTNNLSTSDLSIGRHNISLEIKDSIGAIWTSDVISVSIVPQQFDWSHKELPNALPDDNEDWMSPVKNQGSCGSCWAFAAVGTVEGQYNVINNLPNADINLSEQNLLSVCSSAGSCDGGWTSSAFIFITNSGITTESCYPYKTANNAVCNTACSDESAMTDVWKVSQYKYISQYQYPSIEEYRKKVMDLIMNNGPIQTNFYISGWSSVTYTCSNFTGSHAVVIVGWDDVEGVWIVKNSWGTGWNGNGYFKVKYGECSVDDSLTYIEDVYAP